MWYKIAPACNDSLQTSKQSPINIVTANAVYNSSLELPTFQNYNKVYNTSKFDIINSGHNVKVTPVYGPQDTKASILYKGIFSL